MKKESAKRLVTALASVFCVLTVGLIVLLVVYMINNESSETLEQDTGAAQSDTAQTASVSEEVSSVEAVEAAAPIDSSQAETESSAEAAVDSSAEEEKTAADIELDSRIAEMSLHEKVCQLFIVTPEQLTGVDVVTLAGDTTRDRLEEYPVGGLIYFAQNMQSYDQVSEMIANTQHFNKELGGLPLFISVDEEGGDVARCADTIGTAAFFSMFTYRDEGEQKAYDNALRIAQDIASVGFNLDFAPVADTWSNPVNSVIGTRAYSDDFDETAELVASAVKGFRDGGVFCTIKHFPGHGDTAEDSHYLTAISNKTAEQLEKEEYLAFKSGIEAGTDMVMVGHITVPALDEEPASVSYNVITGELRNKLGYKGVVVTDSLQMAAIADEYSTGELVIKVINAGADILLMPDDLEAAVTALERAVDSGVIEESRIDDSLRRILKLKSERLDID